MKLESHGIQTNLPPGWEGRITVRRKPEAVPGDDGGAAPSARVFSPEHHVSAGGVTAIGDATEQILPVVHLGNFPLPGDRGEVGGGDGGAHGPTTARTWAGRSPGTRRT